MKKLILIFAFMALAAAQANAQTQTVTFDPIDSFPNAPEKSVSTIIGETYTVTPTSGAYNKEGSGVGTITGCDGSGANCTFGFEFSYQVDPTAGSGSADPELESGRFSTASAAFAAAPSTTFTAQATTAEIVLVCGICGGAFGVLTLDVIFGLVFQSTAPDFSFVFTVDDLVSTAFDPTTTFEIGTDELIFNESVFDLAGCEGGNCDFLFGLDNFEEGFIDNNLTAILDNASPEAIQAAAAQDMTLRDYYFSLLTSGNIEGAGALGILLEGGLPSFDVLTGNVVSVAESGEGFFGLSEDNSFELNMAAVESFESNLILLEALHGFTVNLSDQDIVRLSEAYVYAVENFGILPADFSGTDWEATVITEAAEYEVSQTAVFVDDAAWRNNIFITLGDHSGGFDSSAELNSAVDQYMQDNDIDALYDVVQREEAEDQQRSDSFQQALDQAVQQYMTDPFGLQDALGDQNLSDMNDGIESVIDELAGIIVL